jgi:hypothetical protein
MKKQEVIKKLKSALYNKIYILSIRDMSVQIHNGYSFDTYYIHITNTPEHNALIAAIILKYYNNGYPRLSHMASRPIDKEFLYELISKLDLVEQTKLFLHI